MKARLVLYVSGNGTGNTSDDASNSSDFSDYPSSSDDDEEETSKPRRKKSTKKLTCKICNKTLMSSLNNPTNVIKPHIGNTKQRKCLGSNTVAILFEPQSSSSSSSSSNSSSSSSKGTEETMGEPDRRGRKRND